jgi:hypothetical protein
LYPPGADLDSGDAVTPSEQTDGVGDLSDGDAVLGEHSAADDPVQ